MSLQELVIDVGIMLKQLRLEFTEISLLRNITSQFVINDFGTIVCCLDKASYTQIDSKLIDEYSGWRKVFISPIDKLEEAKLEVLWALMRSGYMKWLRYTYPRQVKSILNGTDNLGNRIIAERLRIWNNEPRYKFLINDNMEVKRSGLIMEISRDPGFFDYMPEK